jgi:hypothetical protein
MIRFLPTKTLKQQPQRAALSVYIKICVLFLLPTKQYETRNTTRTVLYGCVMVDKLLVVHHHYLLHADYYIPPNQKKRHTTTRNNYCANCAAV